jgi:hypothetical protein
MLGPSRTTPAAVTPASSGPAASARVATSPSPASPSLASPLASARPRYEILAGPRPTGTVYLRDSGGAGLRALDLASGLLSPRIGPASWPNRVIATADGSFRCVCVTRTDREGTSSVTVGLAPVQGTAMGEPVPLVTVEGRLDPGQYAADQGDSVQIDSAVSPDGTLLALGLAVRKPPVWERSVVLVDLARGAAVQSVALPSEPSRDKPPLAGPRFAGAPRVQFAPDGRHVAITTEAGGAGSADPWPSVTVVAPLAGDRIGHLAELGGLVPAAAAAGVSCAAWAPRFADSHTIYSPCYGPSGTTGVVVVDVARGSPIVVPLGQNPPAFGATLFDPRSNSVYVWDPFNGRIVRVDVRAVRVVAAATVASPTAALNPLDALRRAVSSWIAPSTDAKILLEPALALSADGTRLFLVASSNSDPSTGAVRTIHVVDAQSLEPIDTWAADPDIVSIAVRGDALLVASTTPPATDSAGRDATVTIRDATSGQVRAVIRGLVDSWPVFVDPHGSMP